MEQPAREDAHLFVLRIWREPLEGERYEWRGRLKSVPDGQIYYFRTWPALIEEILQSLPVSQPEPD